MLRISKWEMPAEFKPSQKVRSLATAISGDEYQPTLVIASSPYTVLGQNMATRRPSPRNHHICGSDIIDTAMQSLRNKRRPNEHDAASEDIIEISSDEDEEPARKKLKTMVELENLVKKLKQVASFCKSDRLCISCKYRRRPQLRQRRPKQKSVSYAMLKN